jgi:anti-sigma regulatory factor (Ser/Thr protein kinase)
MKRFQENAIYLPSRLVIAAVRDVQQDITELVDFRGFEKITLDFSNSEIAFAEAVVPLVTFCRKLIGEGVRFQLRLPTLDKLRRLFLNCGWAHLMAPKQHPDPGVNVGENIPAIIFNDHFLQDSTVNSSIDRVMKTIPHLNRENLGALEWSINEICDNVLNHSNSEIGGVFQLNFRPLSREVEFVVSDAGIGIPASLRSIRNKEWSDEFALEQSIRQGVTRDPSYGQGNGLFGTFQIAALSGGNFQLNSGFAHLVATRNGKVEVRADARAFLGTTVVCAVNFSQPHLLERALSFKGTPLVDLVEMQYERGDAAIEFVLRSETESLGTRRAGFDTRRKVENLLAMVGSASLIFNMQDVSVMSSSFADELFAKLARSIGVDAYRAKISFRNLSEINRQLIRRALSQRLGLEE